ncbi:hypothetical protein ACIBSW_19355 [Actinoplanes sp. NPDC049668]|uniref:hypothetical protein n=1 Tax=unclassified Actinoplanes TaxID=2626549 RepID=UPI0033BBCBEE
MSQFPPFGPQDEPPGWPQGYPPAGQPAYPGPATPRFDPADPLVSADFAGWWRRGFAVVRRGWQPLLLIQVYALVAALALMIPAQILFNLSTRDATVDSTAIASAVYGLAAVLVALIYSIATLAAVRLVVTVATGGQAHVGPAVRAVLPRVLPMIGWSLLAGLVIFAGLCACVVPGLYLGAVFVVLPAVVLFEPGEAISRCFRLFHNDFGAAVARTATIVGLLFGITLIFAALSGVVTLITLGSVFADPAAVVGTGALVTDAVLGSILNLTSSLIAGVVLTPLVVATYADLRARREPFSTAYLPAA